MKRSFPLLTFLLSLGVSTFAAEADKEALIKAAKALAEQPGYTWQTTVEVPPDSRFRPGPTSGKLEKGVATFVSTSGFRGNTDMIIAGTKAATTDREGNWQSATEAAGGQGGNRFGAPNPRDFKSPADEALELINGLAALRKEGDAYVSELSEEEAKKLASSGGGRRGGGSNILFAKGAVKFWVEGGILTRFQQVLDASMDFNGSEFVIERTTTTTISDIGKTEVMIPEAAKAKLE
jgi:hypothetical protein